MPIPDRRRFAPEVAGVVVRAGVPVADAEVTLSSAFAKPETSRTDASGRFRLGPLTRLFLTRSVLGDPLYKYSLAIKVAGEAELLGYLDSGIGDAPAALQAACDLNRPALRRKTTTYCVPVSP